MATAPCAGRASDHRAEVPRVGHLVEAAEKGPIDARELPGVCIGIRLTPCDDTLMVGRSRGLRELAFPLRARSWPFLQPVERRCGPLAGPDLQHGTSSSERLADGVAPVHEVTGHARGTSS